jgi:hypothetical protein
VEEVRLQFEKVPYRNSSLFEVTSLKNQPIVISNLRNERTLPVIWDTVLKQESGTKRTGTLNTIEYLYGKRPAKHQGRNWGKDLVPQPEQTFHYLEFDRGGGPHKVYLYSRPEKRCLAVDGY